MATGNKHTLGPWVIYYPKDANKLLTKPPWIADAEGNAIADLGGGDIHYRNAEANAALIAAAPAMRQRLEFAMRLLLQGDLDGAIVEVQAGLDGRYEQE